MHLTLLPDLWAEVGPFRPSLAEDLTVSDNESFADRLAAAAILSSPGRNYGDRVAVTLPNRYRVARAAPMRVLAATLSMRAGL